MSIERYPYNSEQTGQIRHLLQNNAKAGKSLDYEILVDKLRVIPRTNKVEQFDEYEEFVSEDTKSVTIIIYQGNSNKNTRYIFILKEENQQDKSSLSGLEVERIVTEKLEKQKKEIEFELLVKEKEKIQAQLEEAEEYIETLEAKIEEVGNSKGKLSQQWGELASVALEGIIRRNIHKIAKAPGAAALAGIFADETPAPAADSEETTEGEATYRRVNRDEEEISEEDKTKILLVNYMQEKFSEKEFGQIMDIINNLAEKPNAIKSTVEYTKQWKEDGNE